MTHLKSYLKSIAAMFLFFLICANAGAEGESSLGNYPARFVILGDRTGGHVPGLFGKALEEVESLKPDFVLTVGDMIEGYTEDTTILNREWKEFDSIMSYLTMPVYYTPGNHDITTDGMLDHYTRHAGQPYYSFDHRGIHFIILDNSRYTTTDEFSEEQLNWLIEDLQKSNEALFTMAFFHKPFWNETVVEGKPDTLHTLFVNNGVDAVFSGHYHVYFSGEYDGIIYTGVGATGAYEEPGPSGFGNHYVWVTISDEDITIAPISLGSVKPWDEVTAEENNFVYASSRTVISFTEPFTAEDKMSVKAENYEVMIRNPHSEIAMAESLAWKMPLGWSVEPKKLAINIDPLDSAVVHFMVTNDDDIYPVPSLSVKFPYAEGKSAVATTSLRIARKAYCNPVSEGFEIDGKVTEDFWQNPVTRLYSRDGDKSPVDSVYFYFGYDENNLFLAAVCRESQPDSIMASITEHDGPVYGEDCVGYFFRPFAGQDTAYQIYFNPNGAVFDQVIYNDDRGYWTGDRSWNGEYEVKTFHENGYWSVESRIPLKQFGAKLEKGLKWGVNFRRKQKRLDTAGDWQTPIDYNPDTYGILIMK
jgi:predicted phosphodiesterase